MLKYPLILNFHPDSVYNAGMVGAAHCPDPAIQITYTAVQVSCCELVGCVLIWGQGHMACRSWVHMLHWLRLTRFTAAQRSSAGPVQYGLS